MMRSGLLIFVTLMIIVHHVSAKDRTDDTHYTDAGFFDIHVCNWPDRPPFYLAVFSTEIFREVKSITIKDPAGDLVGSIGLDKYRTIKRKKKPLKRAFISHIELPKTPRDGWFTAEIIFLDDTLFVSKDYVTHDLLERAANHVPRHESVMTSAPTRLSWDPIPGAGYYQVFVRDIWDADKLIYSSELITTNHIDLPEKKLKKGGYYKWKVHARDVNEDIMLGDFNLGSQSEWVEFSIE